MGFYNIEMKMLNYKTSLHSWKGQVHTQLAISSYSEILFNRSTTQITSVQLISFIWEKKAPKYSDVTKDYVCLFFSNFRRLMAQFSNFFLTHTRNLFHKVLSKNMNQQTLTEVIFPTISLSLNAYPIILTNLNILPY